jgi:hypothetical protein
VIGVSVKYYVTYPRRAGELSVAMFLLATYASLTAQAVLHFGPRLLWVRGVVFGRNIALGLAATDSRVFSTAVSSDEGLAFKHASVLRDHSEPVCDGIGSMSTLMFFSTLRHAEQRA